MLSAPIGLALSLVVNLPLEANSNPEALPWIHDDWAKAKSQAETQGKLIAVDVWATWCHSCLAMQNYALKTDEMLRLRDQHIWLEMDYDRPKNADFFKTYPINAFPTFMVINPKNSQVIARWLGSGSSEEMAHFFGQAKKQNNDTLALGQQALSNQDYPLALELFSRALKSSKGKETRGPVLSGYIEALWKTDPLLCATEGVKYIDETQDSAPGLDYVMMVEWCASDLKDKDLKQSILQKVEHRLERGIQNPKHSLSADESSGVYASLISIYEGRGEHEKAQAALRSRLDILETAARTAPNLAAAATFDAHRMSCYMKLKAYKKAEEMLQKTEQDLPDDFNTPWRLARLYEAQERFEDGLAAIERALKKGYGPRRLRLYSAKIGLAVAKKDFALARETAKAAHKEIAEGHLELFRKYWLEELANKEALIPKP